MDAETKQELLSISLLMRKNAADAKREAEERREREDESATANGGADK